MAPGGAAAPDPKAAGLQRNIIAEDQHPLRRQPVKPDRLGHRIPGQVHKGLRQQQHQLLPPVGTLTHAPLKLHPVQWTSQATGQGLHGPESGVMPGPVILPPRISQTHNQPIGRWFGKQHQNRLEMEVSV